MANLLTLAGLLLAAGLLLTAGTVLAMAVTLLKPPRMRDGKAAWVLKRVSPGDLGITFEDRSFLVLDESTGRKIRLSGWWMPLPGGSSKTAFLIHGYADGKIGAIAWGPLFQSLGYNLLAIDLRAHGYSEGAKTTAGYFERHDVSQVIDEIRASHPSETRELILFGVSLGAAVASATGAMRPDLRAVILECPYADFRTAALTHAGAMGMPTPLLQRAGIALAERWAGADFDAVAPIRTIPQIQAPLLVLQSCADPLVDPASIDAIEYATRQRPSDRPTRFIRIEGAGHVVGICADPDAYRTHIAEFLSSSSPIPAIR